MTARIDVLDETVTIKLSIPRKAREFCEFEARWRQMDLETYLLQGIKDLIIGELVSLEGSPRYPESAEDLKVFEELLGEPPTEFSTAPRIAEKLGLRDFLVQPHHRDGWDLNFFDIPI